MHLPTVSVRFGLMLEAYCRGCGGYMKELSTQLQALTKMKQVQCITSLCGVVVNHRACVCYCTTSLLCVCLCVYMYVIKQCHCAVSLYCDTLLTNNIMPNKRICTCVMCKPRIRTILGLSCSNIGFNLCTC